jgi:outer membrane lipoprotein-sorting protein
MRRSALIGLGAVLSVWSAAAHAVAVDEVVRHVQERFDATKDLSAAVDQELVVASAGKTMHAKGTVAFKRPGKMRWSLTDGSTQVIVADGKTLWFYQPDEQQVLTAPFQAAFIQRDLVLTRFGRLSDDSTWRSRGRRGKSGLPSSRARASRLAGCSSAWMRSRTTSSAPRSSIRSATTRLRFSDLRRNTGLDEAQFHFEVPPGVDVIEAPIGN